MLRNALKANEASLLLLAVLDKAKQHYAPESATPIAIEELPKRIPAQWVFRVSFREQPDIDVALHEDYIEELLHGKGE